MTRCFALGEYKFGAAQVYQHVVRITLGTGLGAGIIVNGHLYCGFNCAAGEWCSAPYLDQDFEFIAAVSFSFQIQCKGQIPFKKAAQGDVTAQAYGEYGRHLVNSLKTSFIH